MITKHPEHRHSSWKKLQCHPTPCSVWGRQYCYNYNVLSSVFTAANWSDHNTSANPRRKKEDSLQIADCHAEMNVHFYSVFIMTRMIQTCKLCLLMFGMESTLLRGGKIAKLPLSNIAYMSGMVSFVVMSWSQRNVSQHAAVDGSSLTSLKSLRLRKLLD